MKTLFAFIGGLASRVESWWALVILLAQVGVFAWLSNQVDVVSAHGWAATVLVGVLGAALLTIALTLVYFAITRSRANNNGVEATAKATPALPPPTTPQTLPSNGPIGTAMADAILASHPAPKSRSNKPAAPVFGSPRQLGGEPYLSWWHIPITVDGGSDFPNGKIEHCTVEIVPLLPLTMANAISLRWQSGDDPRGTEEIVLVEGRDRMVPIAIRCEMNHSVPEPHRSIADGVSRITGTAYLRDSNHNKFRLDPGEKLIRLRISSGKLEWTSPSYYLRIPNAQESNGSFILELRSI